MADYWDYIAESNRSVFFYVIPAIILMVGLVVLWLSITGELEIYYLIIGFLLAILPAYYFLKKLKKMKKK